MTPEKVAELAYWHVSLGPDPEGWRRFWRRMVDLVGGEPLTGSRSVEEADRLARHLVHLSPIGRAS